MKVTKFGHSCLLVEMDGARILLDPGVYSTAEDKVKGLDAILITHEHFDHLDIDLLKRVLEKNVHARIFTNKGAGSILRKEGITHELVEDGMQLDVKGVCVEVYGDLHAVLYRTVPRVPNTGYFIGGRLFYPGDALFKPPKPVEILALPVTAPWSKISEVVDYAIDVKPRVAFPVHDGMLKNPSIVHRVPQAVLLPLGIEFVVIQDGETAQL